MSLSLQKALITALILGTPLFLWAQGQFPYLNTESRLQTPWSLGECCFPDSKREKVNFPSHPPSVYRGDPHRGLMVMESEFATLSTNDDRFHYMGTLGLFTCVAVLIESPRTGKVSLAHFNTRNDVSTTMDQMLKSLGVTKQQIPDLKVTLVSPLGYDTTFNDIFSELDKHGMTNINAFRSESFLVHFNDKGEAQYSFNEILSDAVVPFDDRLQGLLQTQADYMDSLNAAQPCNDACEKRIWDQYVTPAKALYISPASSAPARGGVQSGG